CFVKSVDQEARLLKLNGKEKRSRNVDALHLDAVRVRAAAFDIVDPVSQTAGIGFAIKKIAVVLGHKELRIVDLVRRQGAESETAESLVRRVVGARENRTVGQEAVLKAIRKGIDARRSAIAAAAVKSS